LHQCARSAGDQHCRCFDAINAWVFDLDNTLYPAECNLFVQIADRMNAYIEGLFGVSEAEAREIRRDYYLRFGTTLAGLMELHGVAPDKFLAFVHDIDHSPLVANERLASGLARLPGRRFIFTNGTRGHAESVAEHVGILHLFEEIFDIKDARYIPKPHQDTFKAFLAGRGIEPDRAVMFEDLPHNLVTAHDLGMTTVLIRSSYGDHPSQNEVVAGKRPPRHIHHMTEDLAGFLDGIGRQTAAGPGAA